MKWKHYIAVFAALLLTITPFALADRGIKIGVVGNETKNLKYQIVDSGISYWTTSYNSKRIFAFIAIKNTEKSKYIYLDRCNFDYENDMGSIIDTSYTVQKAPDVIAPGEIGYYYVAGGSLDDDIDISRGINLVAQFSLKESNKKVDYYTITDTKFGWNDDKPLVKGRITNNTSEDDGSVEIICIFRNASKKTVWIDSTYVHDLYAGTTLGFSISTTSSPPNIKKGSLKSFKAFAKPEYYQW